MQKKALAVAMTALGLTAAIAIPTIAFGNARSDFGSFNYLKVGNTPLTARLSGANEVPPGDPDGFGAAAVTIDINGSSTEVCWDLTYGKIQSPPTQAAIRAGAAGSPSGIIIVPLTSLGPSSASGCAGASAAVVQQILDAPQDFYVDIRTSEVPNGALRGQLSAGDPPAGEAHMLASPLRAYDSRDNGGPKLAPNVQSAPISLAEGKDGAGNTVMALPPGATAAIVTLTVTETVAPGGFVKLYSAALKDPPATSNINWAGANQNLAVSTQVAVDTSGSVKIIGGGASTHVIIDVIGYLF